MVRREDLRLSFKSAIVVEEFAASRRFEQERAAKRERCMPWREDMDVWARGWRMRSWGDGRGTGSKTGDGARGGGEAGRANIELAGIFLLLEECWRPSPVLLFSL